MTTAESSVLLSSDDRFRDVDEVESCSRGGDYVADQSFVSQYRMASTCLRGDIGMMSANFLRPE